MAARSYPTTRMCDGELLARFEPTVRDSDVFISTSAKCGQTWLQSLLFHLKTRGREPDFRGLGLGGVSPWLEIPRDFATGGGTMDRDARLAEFSALDDPRVFKMHVVWEEIPRPPNSRAKVITITRDPREVPFSMFSHLHGMKLGEDMAPPENFDSYFETWMSFGFYFTFVRSFWPHRHDTDVLWLRYEDMHLDLRAQVRRIVEFLGWRLDAEDVERVLPLVDFARMRATEKSEIFRDRSPWKETGQFFREGAVGKNRARLNAEHERRIVERTHADLGPECARFVLSLDAATPAAQDPGGTPQPAG